MLSFKYEERGENRFLVYQMNPEDQVDSMVIGQLSDTYNRINGVLTIVQVEINNQTLFKINVTGKITLAEYFSKPVKPEKLLEVYKQILSVFIEAEEYMLDSSVFMLDEQYIFVDPANGQVFLIASPVIQETVILKDFFQRLLFQQYDTTSDTSIVMELTAFFSVTHTFSQESFYKKIKEIEASEKAHSVKRVSGKNEENKKVHMEYFNDMGFKETMKERQVQKEESEESPSNKKEMDVDENRSFDFSDHQEDHSGEENIIESNDSKKKGLWGLLKLKKDKSLKTNKKSETGKSTEQSKIAFAIPGRDNANICHDKDDSEGKIKNDEGIQTQKINIDNIYKNETRDFGETEIFDDVTEMEKGQELFEDEENDYTELEETELTVCLKLEDSCGYKVPEIIKLNLSSGCATIGRYDKTGQACADFNFDYSLTFISREHIKIIFDEEGLQIIDLKSTNGTLLNGELLSADKKYSLCAGDRIMFSRKTKLTYSLI